MRRLEEDHGSRLGGELGDAGGPLPRLAWEEALEAEAIGRQPGECQGGEHRARPGDRGDVHTSGDRLGDDPIARVAHRRHPRIGDDHDGGSRSGTLDELRGTHLLIGIEVRDDGTGDLDAQTRCEATQSTGVLRGDDVGGLEQSDEPRARILEVAQRRCGQDDHARGGIGVGRHGAHRVSSARTMTR